MVSDDPFHLASLPQFSPLTQQRATVYIPHIRAWEGDWLAEGKLKHYTSKIDGRWHLGVKLRNWFVSEGKESHDLILVTMN